MSTTQGGSSHWLAAGMVHDQYLASFGSVHQRHSHCSRWDAETGGHRSRTVRAYGRRQRRTSRRRDARLWVSRLKELKLSTFALKRPLAVRYSLTSSTPLNSAGYASHRPDLLLSSGYRDGDSPPCQAWPPCWPGLASAVGKKSSPEGGEPVTEHWACDWFSAAYVKLSGRRRCTACSPLSRPQT